MGGAFFAAVLRAVHISENRRSQGGSLVHAGGPASAPLLEEVDPLTGRTHASQNCCSGFNLESDPIECDKEWDVSVVDLLDCAYPGATVSAVGYQVKYDSNQAISAECTECYGQLDIELCNPTRCVTLHSHDPACCNSGQAQAGGEALASGQCVFMGSTSGFAGDQVSQRWSLHTRNACDSCAEFTKDYLSIMVYFCPPASPGLYIPLVFRDRQ